MAKIDNGFSAVSCDNQLIQEMNNDIQAELVKQPGRKKIPYREMIAIYRHAWLEQKND